MQIIDGKKISEGILENIKDEIRFVDFKPVFCDILVGNDPASIQYVRMKKAEAENVGFVFHEAIFGAFITTPELIKEIQVLNKMKNMCGIIVQLPLPRHIDTQMVLDSIDARLDVDCLGTITSKNFYDGFSTGELGFPTALACLAVLGSINLDFKDKKIVVLGQGMLVGKPVTALLRFRNLSPITIMNETPNKEELIKNADVIISGIGQGKYITGNMIKEGAVLIDAGTSELNGGIVGDVDLDSVKDVAGFVSPVPGGVGPVTVAMLLQNVLMVAKKRVN
ncbi:MAG: bifunctional 5,10-methylenetetrahydrofolate dehydrogenase/5,10-methenyltetrahydrofolate cyclohydrolase [Candidatus Parcubacteria bacterium]|nr:bifunctional 5,10-methylenetetrahydrofolate dehydrogenase/5,10-methenyltetrahydrofolate cyclohydrolase [Candidatus Parcubacteria bacterium]